MKKIKEGGGRREGAEGGGRREGGAGGRREEGGGIDTIRLALNEIAVKTANGVAAYSATSDFITVLHLLE